MARRGASLPDVLDAVAVLLAEERVAAEVAVGALRARGDARESAMRRRAVLCAFLRGATAEVARGLRTLR
jgi:hypothetical protein